MMGIKARVFHPLVTVTLDDRMPNRRGWKGTRHQHAEQAATLSAATRKYGHRLHVP
jgi:hypothetical protein